MERIFCFDFDGTLTCKDTLIAFIRYAKGTTRLIMGLLLFLPILILMKLRLFANWRAKQIVFTYFFGGMPLRSFEKLCTSFARDNQHILRPDTMETLRKAADQGARIIIVSASVDTWVSAFFAEQGLADKVEVLGTKVAVDEGGFLTGRFATPNCYGPEKVRRLKEALPLARSLYYIEAYGDSRGDKEMLAFADKGTKVERK